MIVVVVALGLVVAVLALLVVGLLRSHAEILKRLHELGAGVDSSAVPTSPGDGPRPGRDFQVMPQMPSPPDREAFGGVADLAGLGPGAGEALTVRITGVEHDTIVAFLSSGCLTCQKFWDAFRKPRKLGLPSGTRLVVVTKGPDAESPSAVAELAPPSIPTVMSSEAFTDYDVPGSPYFVQVHGPTGKVRGEGTGPDWDQVSSLLRQAGGDAELTDALAGSQVAKPDADADRESRIDRELYSAGVAPGDVSLYSPPEQPDDRDHDAR
ncbi:hypothetical protein BH23ACT2_BH23ACT2_25910 [soil metagenome]